MKTVFIGNLNYKTTLEDLQALIDPEGTKVARWSMPTDRETGRVRGFAFAEFEDDAVADEVITQFADYMMDGRPLKVNEARAKEDRPRRHDEDSMQRAA